MYVLKYSKIVSSFCIAGKLIVKWGGRKGDTFLAVFSLKINDWMAFKKILEKYLSDYFCCISDY